MPKEMAVLAIFMPIAPKPTTPSVFPGSSKPTKFFLPASTCLVISASDPFNVFANYHAEQMLRALSNMPVKTSS